MSDDIIEIPEPWRTPDAGATIEPVGLVTHNVEPPADGLYPAVDFATYVSWDAINSHVLNLLATRTPAHVQHELMHGGSEPTKATSLGWLTHLAVLEPDRFDSTYVVPPKVDRRTKLGKAQWADFVMANEGKEFADGKDYFGALAMKQALAEHETACEFFGGQGVTELSAVWTDIETGVRCKARIDKIGFVGEWPIIADLKTADNAARFAFEKSIKTYGYHIQAIHYLNGLGTLVPTKAGAPFRRFAFFVVESKLPHLVAVWELAEEALAVGADERRRALLTWKRCRETGIWPGYHAGIDLIGLPAWAYKSWTPDV